MKFFQRLTVGLALVCVQLTVHAADQVIEEIVVMATKRESTVMEIPASVTAFDSDRIELKEMTSNNDLQYSVPGIAINNYNGRSSVVIRGIGSGSGSAGSVGGTAVAQHIDGVYQSRVQTIALALNDLERLELLKGPQGTLYGRNSTGGAINYVTKKPTEEWEGSVSLTVGNFNRKAAKLMLSGPLSDTVSVRANLYYNEEDGYLEVVGGGGSPDIHTQDILGGRLALRITPSDDLTIDLNVTHIENETLRTAQILAIVNPALAFHLAPDNHTLEPNKIFSDLDGDGKVEQDSFTATIDWAINDEWSLKSITGYSENYWCFCNYDVDWSSSPIFSAFGVAENESETLSQEFNLSYTGYRLDLVTGLFYFKDEVEQPQGFPAFGVVFEFDQQTDAWAAFADATYNVTDELRLLAGIRYNYEETEISQLSSTACPLGVTDKEDWSATNPKIGVQYDVSDNAMIYGTWQEGFKAGGFDPANCVDDFNPENIEAIEFGLKASLFDGAGLLSVAIFDYDYKDLQVSQLVGLVVNIENAGEAKVLGAEFDFQYALSDRWTMELSGTYLDTEQNDLSLADAHGGGGFVDVSGKTLRRAPEFSGTFALAYDVGFDNGNQLQLRGEVYYSDDARWRFIDTDPFSFRDAHTTGNLYANLKLGAVEGLSLRGYVKNVSDKEVLEGSSAIAFLGLQIGNLTRGRTFGLEAKYDF